MTALAAVPLAAPRPVPWTRLGWVVWRRYRPSLIAVFSVLGLLAIYLVIDGERIRNAFHAAVACRPVDSAACRFQFQNFHDDYAQPGFLAVVLLFLPGVIGAFVGAPVLARELESGTYRYAWTQGVGRMRWTVAVVASAAVGVSVIMGAFGLLYTWHEQPLFTSQDMQRLHNTVFPVTGLAVAGWALIGFALGIIAGLLWRRVVAAVATACVAWFGLAFLAAQTLRSHYLAPLTTTRLNIPPGALMLNQWWERDGARVSDRALNSVLGPIGSQVSGGGSSYKVGSPSASTDPVQYLLQHGYQQVSSYQPESRYWTFQWIEFGWLSALALVLLGVSLWLVRRRPA